MAPGKWGLASESSWVCLRDAEHPPLELNLVIFAELVLSVFSLCFSWKISLFASCRSCWACSARLDLSGKIPEFPNVRISVWSPSNTIRRREVQLRLKLVEFLPWFHLGLSQNFIQENSSPGSCEEWAVLKQLPVLWPSSSLAAPLGSAGALLALTRVFAKQLHPGVVCK